ncbi:hypothetical protein TNCV_3942661 [Trichonephila clavipes]|nr:hypothetical protein TNCV_3942661 [Trichonephila clavipes]
MNDIDSQKHQNNVFKRRVEPKVTIHGDLCSEKKAVTPASWDGKKWREKCKVERPLRKMTAGEKLAGEIGTENGKRPGSLTQRQWGALRGLKEKTTLKMPPSFSAPPVKRGVGLDTCFPPSE